MTPPVAVGRRADPACPGHTGRKLQSGPTDKDRHPRTKIKKTLAPPGQRQQHVLTMTGPGNDPHRQFFIILFGFLFLKTGGRLYNEILKYPFAFHYRLKATT